MRFVNAKVYTQDRNRLVAASLSCQNGRITAVGDPGDLPPGGDEIDLRGRVVLPGLIDAHAHLCNLAEARRSIDLSDAGSAEEAAGLVAARLAHVNDARWVAGRGWDQTSWRPEAAFPNAEPLDRVAPRNPVALTRIDGHALWVNHAALRAAGIDRETVDPPGGRILRDPAGLATGVLIDAAMRLVRDQMPQTPENELVEAIGSAIDECLRFGLTGIHEMGADDRVLDIYRSLIDAGRFPFRVLAAINGPGKTWQSWRERGPERRYGDRLSVAAIKLYADGALGSRGAAMLAPYADDPENRGLELASKDDLERWTRDAVTHGFQVCIHAIGDRGNRTVLDAYERVLAEHPGEDRRLRVEHAQILSGDDLPRFKRLGIIPSMQATHCTSDMAWTDARLGAERTKLAYPWRSLIDSGVIIAGGSDFPVESPNPMLGLSASVTRLRPSTEEADSMRSDLDAGWPSRAHAEVTQAVSSDLDAGWHPEQRMSREEAVRSFTTWAAYAGFDERVSGALAPGMYADFIVLDRDVMTCPPQEIARIRVLMTVSGGEIVYADKTAW